MNSIELQVQGMSCGACVKHVSQALQALEGVDQVSVNLDDGRVSVGGNADAQSLIAALDAAGYPARRAEPSAAPQSRQGGCGSGCGCN